MRRAPRLCRCGLTIAHGQPCPACEAVRTRRADARPSASDRGYDAEWRKATRGYLTAHPFCSACAKAGLQVAAEVVGHVVSIRQDPGRRLDPANWTPLCRAHNARDAHRERQTGGRSTTLAEISQTTGAPVVRTNSDFFPRTGGNREEAWPW